MGFLQTVKDKTVATVKFIDTHFRYVIFAVVLLVPTIYSFFYLLAYWDPYGRANKVPVVIVNEDVGPFGKSITESLLDEKPLDVTEKTLAEAEEGLKDQDYYAILHFPQNFSANLASAAVSNTPATLLFSPNQKANFLAYQIVNSAVQILQSTIRSTAYSTAISSLVDNTLDLSEGIITLDSVLSKLKLCFDQGQTDRCAGLFTQLVSSDNYAQLKAGSQALTALSTVDDYKKPFLQFVSEPVSVEEETVGPIKYYGVSFIPMFMSLGNWLACLMSYLTFYYDQNHRFGILDIKRRGFTQNFAYIGLACCFGPLCGAMLMLSLYFKPTNVWLFFFSTLLIPVAFMSLIQLFIRVLGDIGKFLILIIMILQLCAAGPTFPIEVVSPGLKWLNPILPMTYSIRLIKECVISRTTNKAANNITTLILFFFFCFLLTSLYDFLRVFISHKKAQAAKSEKENSKTAN